MGDKSLLILALKNFFPQKPAVMDIVNNTKHFFFYFWALIKTLNSKKKRLNNI